MICIKEFNSEKETQTLDILEEFKNPTITRENFRLLLTHPFKSDQDIKGYVLLDDDRVVGFIGTILSKRMINGKEESFCNLTSWIVKDKYRSHAFILLSKVLKLKNYTVTNLSLHSDQLITQYRKMGFETLEDSVTLIFSTFLTNQKIHITSDDSELKQRLSDSDRCIYNDHKNIDCYHLLVCSAKEYCYIVFTKARKRFLKINRIHYISHPELFVRHAAEINESIKKRTGSYLTVTDTRLLGGYKIPLSYQHRLKHHKLFKSETLQKEQIDNLYSELLLLRF